MNTRGSSVCLLNVLCILIMTLDSAESAQDNRKLISSEEIAAFSSVVAKLMEDVKEELRDNPVHEERGSHQCLRTSDGGRDVEVIRREGSDDVTLSALLYKSEAWSACRRSCVTSRVRKCRLKKFCSVDILVEEAYCYAEGTKCERKVKKMIEEKGEKTRREKEERVEDKKEEKKEKDVTEQPGEEEETPEVNKEIEDQENEIDATPKPEERKQRKPNKQNRKPNQNQNDQDDYIVIPHPDYVTDPDYLPDPDYLYGVSDYSYSLHDVTEEDTEGFFNQYPNYYFDNGDHPAYDYTETDVAVRNAVDRTTDPPVIRTGGDTIRPKSCGDSPISAPSKLFRIIGGWEAVKDSWPWQVAVLNRFKEVFCGGTLISSRWVLTAAHCIKRTLYVRVGEHNIVVPDGEIELKVAQSFIHPSFDRITIDSDIGLLKLPKDVIKTSSSRLKRACLPPPSTGGGKGGKDGLPKKQPCVVLGWGKERESFIFGSDVLRYAKVPIVSRKTCEKAYRDQNITRNMFCAGVLQGGMDACEGDSGGPLLCQNQDQKWVLHGVTSFGEGCGEKKKLGVYVKVANYLSWINDTISAN